MRRRFDVAAGIGIIPILAALVSVPLAIFSIPAARDRSSGSWPLRLFCLAAVDLLGVVCAIYLMHSGIRAQRQPVHRARIGIAAAPAQVLLPWLEHFLSSRTALAISAGIFAVQHLAYGPGVAAVFVTALVLGWARQRTGGLAPPLFIHTAYNGVSALVRAWRYN